MSSRTVCVISACRSNNFIKFYMPHAETEPKVASAAAAQFDKLA